MGLGANRKDTFKMVIKLYSHCGCISLLFLTIFLRGCIASEEPEKVTPIPSPEVMRYVIKKLDTAGIKYIVRDNNKLAHTSTDTQEIASIISDAVLEELPKDRSFSPANKHLFECYVSELDKKSVPYSIKTLFEKKWIVLENEKSFDRFSVCSPFDEYDLSAQ